VLCFKKLEGLGLPNGHTQINHGSSPLHVNDGSGMARRERQKCDRCEKWREKSSFQKGNAQCYNCAGQCKPCGFIDLPIDGNCPLCPQRKKQRDQKAGAVQFAKQSKGIKANYINVLESLRRFHKNGRGFSIIPTFTDNACREIYDWMNCNQGLEEPINFSKNIKKTTTTKKKKKKKRKNDKGDDDKGDDDKGDDDGVDR
jgi:hypothetical protein